MIARIRAQSGLLLAAALTLSACAGRPPALQTAADFSANGKLTVRGAAGNLSARFAWQQLGDAYDVEVWGPFGQGRRRLQGNPAELKVLTGDDRVLLSGPPEDIVEQSLGFALPLAALRYWIQGQASPDYGLSAVQRDAVSGELSSFEQAGWRVAFADRELSGRPKIIKLNGRGYQVSVRVSRWVVRALATPNTMPPATSLAGLSRRLTGSETLTKIRGPLGGGL
ncbi:MAG: lipoprotein insertase outer membrane protein LolB [Pseudomonadota bacterium]